uniref:heat shock factor protein 5-like n=1 Tax=Odobenus rosmarus divergens TaxID=9708 RepID=UPI00063CA71F
MASQSTDEICPVKLAPPGDGESAPAVPSTSSLGPNLDSREIFEKQEDPAVSRDPDPQDNPQPEAPNLGAANVGQNILGLSFPRKLWSIVEDNAFTSVRWDDDGDTVIIDEDLFQREVLHRRGPERIFETDSLKGFIRLMNLYGFGKIRPDSPSVCAPGNERMMLRVLEPVEERRRAAPKESPAGPSPARERRNPCPRTARSGSALRGRAQPDQSCGPRLQHDGLLPRGEQVLWDVYLEDIFSAFPGDGLQQPPGVRSAV